MRSKQRLVIFIALMLCTLMMSGCGIRSGKPAAADMVNPPEQTVIDQSSPVLQSPVPVSSPAIMQSPAQTPEVTPPIAAGQTTAGGQNQTGSQSSGSTPPQTAAPVLTPSPAQTAKPVQTPVPTPKPANAGLPTVTKSPTGETVSVGGSCYFVAKYENAIYAEWHFVSPDGSRDLDYSQAAKEFSGLEIVNGYASTMQLKNIPASLNGWNVYCRFSNKAGAVTTGRASITVNNSQPAGIPLITKNPTGETVAPGGSCCFVARYKDAIWAEWHFVSPDGSRDILYTQAGKEFSGLTVSGGNSSVLKLGSIPASLNGWSVYCRFTNNVGAANTAKAGITVTGGQAVIISGEQQTPGGTGSIVPAGPGSVGPEGPGTVVPGGPGSSGPEGPGTVVPGGPGSSGPEGPGTVVPGDPGSSGPSNPGDSPTPDVIIIG